MPIAVVTGAGSGIGHAVARALLAEGYTVALAGRRAEALLGTVGGVEGAHGLVIPTDVTDADAVAALFATVRQHFGRVDLLFNNAGMFGDVAEIDELSLVSWERTLRTNLTGAFLCAQAAFRMMRSQEPQGGRIINNGSISAQVPRPCSTAYTVSKHGLTGLTRALALEGRRHRIACGQIDIGNAATDMTAPMPHGVVQPDGTLAAEATFDVGVVADAVLQMAAMPLDANVLSMTLIATAMPFVGRG